MANSWASGAADDKIVNFGSVFGGRGGIWWGLRSVKVFPYTNLSKVQKGFTVIAKLERFSPLCHLTSGPSGYRPSEARQQQERVSKSSQYKGPGNRTWVF